MQTAPEPDDIIHGHDMSDHGSDMQVSESEEEMDVEDEQPTIEVEEPDVVVDEDEEADELSDKEDELEDDEEEGSDVDVEAPDPGPSLPPRLRIKLKLPQQSEASSVAATATPTPDGTSRRRILPRGSDIESEDSDEDDDDSDSVAATPGRPLTARQAVLRNVVDSSHVSLAEPPNPRKKKALTEVEIALKREETARKRKNLSEKKLEDEKAETINRLLKKQSRKGKRSALSTAEDRPTPGIGQDDVEEGEETGSQTPAPPTMYRWVSTTKMPAMEGSDERRMVMTFSVPISVLPAQADAATQPVPPNPPSAPPSCDVDGCIAQRKYRLVKDWHKGACSMAHLKALEAI
ncbi:PAPA-1 domain-containing protein [Phanerochaete sordida]|uniref:PAPA-1 domain-containing protein n=1 Tax=Phanerochaete sordida TaxID=48140 RepID=A0A9P3G0K4_9APHY|nr:PAPA-1 domain-containing protein [Phanerochaete sordida]